MKKMNDSELDHSKRLALEIKENIETATKEERLEILNDLYNKWIIGTGERGDPLNYLKIAVKNFNCSFENLQIGTFDRAKKVVLFQLLYLKNYMNQDIEDKIYNEEKFTKLFKALVDADNAISSLLFLKSSMTQEDIGQEKKSKHDMFRYTEIDVETLNNWQSLLLYLLEKLQRKEYRRYVVDGSGSCYQKVYNEDGYDTHSWEYAMTIEEFILDSTRKDYNFAMWQNLTSSKGIDATTDYLTRYLGSDFDDLKRDRNVFSFKNGIYITKFWNEEKEIYEDKWIEYGTKKVGASVVACKLFNLVFEYEEFGDNWFDIIKNKCLTLMTVFKYQQWSENMMKWLCILIGRMLYEVGELDDWQIMMYFLGVGGSGKSTIMEHVIKQIYEMADVAVLSNNIERKFGLSAIYNKFIFIAPEIKEDLCLEQAELQSMISGESVQINIKHKQAITVKFKTPGAFSGNETPGYADNSGSITRRFAIFPFDYKVKKGDTKLAIKLKKEMANIIQACNKGYLDTINKNGSSGIWDILPEEFKQSQSAMAENTNPLVNFLKSGKLEFNKDLYIREKVFVDHFNQHCLDNKLSSKKWSSQFFASPFSDMNLTLIRGVRRQYPNVKGADIYQGNFILGLDLLNSVVKTEDDSDNE